MKMLGQNKALENLQKIKTEYRAEIQTYETKAKSCLTCETKGACCLDEHFVNVRITRLEATAIQKVLSNLREAKQAEIRKKISAAVENYNLTETDFSKTFACPLFEKDTGCLVHSVKPVPCIQHACYERREHLPPDELQDEIELKIERLNQKTYGKTIVLLIPLALQKVFEQN